MSYAQRRLSRFLDAEMHHSLGAYGVVCDELGALLEDLSQQRDPDQQDVKYGLPREVVERTLDLNRELRDKIHRADQGHRHPDPPHDHDIFLLAAEARSHQRIFHFYKLALSALSEPNHRLAPHLLFTSAREGREDDDHLRKGRSSRFAARLEQARQCLDNHARIEHEFEGSLRARLDFENELFSDSLAVHRQDALHRYVLLAFADAHLRMHHVEHKVGSSRVDLQACKLEYSIVSPK